MAAWDSIPDDEKPFQRRLMEVFAGFTEHADYNAGRVIDEIEREGKLDNTLVFYIWGDNGSSSEGSVRNHQRAAGPERDLRREISQHLAALDELGGLDALGGAKTDNMYHAGWAWAGSTPYQGTKLMGSYFGGIRQPLAVAWPKGIKADPVARPQFHHVIDIVPTIYELTHITPPHIVNGFEQDSIDGVSMAYAFADPAAEGRRKTQFFDIMASRGIYHDGWFASAPGPREPWVGGLPKGVKEWSPLTDRWELYNIDEDWSQAHDLAAENPAKLEEMKDLFLIESTKNLNLPIGGGLWSTAMFHPEDAPASSLTEWNFYGPMTRMPESAAPKLGKVDSVVSMDLDVPENANGVLYALAGVLRRHHASTSGRHPQLRVQSVRRSTADQDTGYAPLPADRSRSRSCRSWSAPSAAPMDVTLKVNGEIVAEAACARPCRCTSPRTPPSTLGPTSIRRCRSTTSTRPVRLQRNDRIDQDAYLSK